MRYTVAKVSLALAIITAYIGAVHSYMKGNVYGSVILVAFSGVLFHAYDAVKAVEACKDVA